MGNSVRKWMSWDAVGGCMQPYEDVYLTLLCRHIQQCNMQLVSRFIGRVEDINSINIKRGLSPLHIAVESGSSMCVWTVMRHGADVNVQDCRNFTPLHIAAEVKSIDIKCCQYLIDGGAHLDTQDVWGKTPLHRAIIFHNFELALLLLSSGCDIKITDGSGRAALSLLASENIPPKTSNVLLEAFLKRGADINQKDNKDRTPLYYAVLVKNIPFLVRVFELGIPMEFKGLLHLAVSKFSLDCTKTLLLLGASVPKRLFHAEFIKLCSYRMWARESGAFVVLNTLLRADGRFASKQVVLEYLALVVSAITLNSSVEVPDELVNLVCTLITMNSMPLDIVWPVIKVSKPITDKVAEKLEYKDLPTLAGFSRTAIRNALLASQPNAVLAVNRLTMLPIALRDFLLFGSYGTDVSVLPDYFRL